MLTHQLTPRKKSEKTPTTPFSTQRIEPANRIASTQFQKNPSPSIKDSDSEIDGFFMFVLFWDSTKGIYIVRSYGSMEVCQQYLKEKMQWLRQENNQEEIKTFAKNHVIVNLGTCDGVSTNQLFKIKNGCAKVKIDKETGEKFYERYEKDEEDVMISEFFTTNFPHIKR